MTKMYSSSSRKYFFLFLLSCGLCFHFIIPPFQNPDEPQHFDAILSYASPEQNNITREKRVIELMDDHQFWKYLGIGRPETLPTELTRIALLKQGEFKQKFGNRVLYHRFIGSILKLISQQNTTFSYYFSRFLSFFFVMLAFFLIIPTFTKLSSAYDSSLQYGPLFILFISQFIIISISINPDSLAILLGSLFFYAAISLMTDGIKPRFIIIIILAALAGMITDRSCVFMLIALGLLPFFLLKKKNMHYLLLVIFSAYSALLIAFSWFVWYHPDVLYKYLESFRFTQLVEVFSLQQILSFSSFKQLFFIHLLDSFFLKFGWMAFSAHDAVYITLRIFVTLAALGFLAYLGKRFVARVKKKERSRAPGPGLRIALFSLLALLLQILALWAYFGVIKTLPQGRYLFPVIVPTAFLFTLGLKTLFEGLHEKAGKIVLTAFVLFQFFLFNWVVWNHLVPVFHLTLLSPHPGT